MFLSRSQNKKMFRSFLFLFLGLLCELAAEKLQAPGEVNCPTLQVGHRVHTDYSCTSTPSAPGTFCTFNCSRGYMLNGPPAKRCQIDGSWTDAALSVSCDDANECAVNNGFCSHICKNTPGSYQCSCPAPFYLDPKDQRTCKARGVQLSCKPNHMEIVLPKNLINNLEHEHLSLLDPKCKASGNATHYSLSTAVTECGTRSHAYKNFIVYSNRVLESPDEDSDVFTHVGKDEIKVPFSCYFNDLEIVHAVGFKPVAEKIHVYVKGRGDYALSLDIFKDQSYGEGARALMPASAKYTEADFPISVHLRERVYVQASLDTREKDLKVFLSNCCSTPMQDHEATMKFRHPLIVKGCPRDPSVQFHSSSDPTKVRFSFEAFEFLGDHDYVFVHCRIHVCDVNNNNSRCAKGCIADGNSPVVQDHAKQSEKSVVQPANEKRAKKTPRKQEAHSIPEKLARGAKTAKLRSTAKKVVEKPAVQSKGKLTKKVVSYKPLQRVKKVQDHAKLLAKKNDAAESHRIMKPAVQSKEKGTRKVVSHLPLQRVKKVQDHAKLLAKNDAAKSHRIMKRATKRSNNRGMLGSAEVSKGPFILEVGKRKARKREFKSKSVFAHAKRNGISRDVRTSSQKRSSVAPSASNILLVALTVASIMALAGVTYLGQKAVKANKNPYNFEPLAIN